MGVQEWIALFGAAVSAAVAVTPWMFAVHAKLAVIATQIETLCERAEQLSRAHEDRFGMCLDHQSRLDRLEMRIDVLDEC